MPALDSRAVAPSRLARFVAAKTWPGVQRQQKLDAGVFRFDSMGHGGIVALVGAAQLDSDALDAARATRRIEIVYAVRYRRGVTLVGPRPYKDVAELDAWATRRAAVMYEVWTGEEDCEWATVLLATTERARARDFDDRAAFADADDVDRIAYLLEICREWAPDFLERYRRSEAATT